MSNELGPLASPDKRRELPATTTSTGAASSVFHSPKERNYPGLVVITQVADILGDNTTNPFARSEITCCQSGYPPVFVSG